MVQVPDDDEDYVSNAKYFMLLSNDMLIRATNPSIGAVIAHLIL